MMRHRAGIRLRQSLTIDQYLAVTHLHTLTRPGDDPFDKITIIFPGIFKNDDIPALRRTKIDEPSAPLAAPFFANDIPHKRNICQAYAMDTIDKFVDENMIPNQKRRFHGTGGDFKRLDHKKPHNKRQPNGNDHGFDQFTSTRFHFVLLHVLLFPHRTPA